MHRLTSRPVARGLVFSPCVVLCIARGEFSYLRAVSSCTSVRSARGVVDTVSGSLVEAASEKILQRQHQKVLACGRQFRVVVSCPLVTLRRGLHVCIYESTIRFSRTRIFRGLSPNNAPQDAVQEEEWYSRELTHPDLYDPSRVSHYVIRFT